MKRFPISMQKDLRLKLGYNEYSLFSALLLEYQCVLVQSKICKGHLEKKADLECNGAIQIELEISFALI
jgi:hypothetical protein